MDAEIKVIRNGRTIKTVVRPVHVVGGHKEVTYKGQRYIISRGNRITLGEATLGSPTPPAACSGSDVSRRADVPTESDWTADQRAVITAPVQARIIVEAAPGTGKTAVACARIAYFLGDHIPASNIWLISFTRTAIQEIRNRIAQLSDKVEDAYGVRIATIDSHAWQLRQGFDGKRRNVFSTFEQGIDDALAMLERPDRDLLGELESIDHLIIDEAQDVVGVRRDLLLRLITLIRADAGVTVLCDPAQAIYGFTEDDAPVAGDEPLPEQLKVDEAAGFETRELADVIRTDSPGLRHIFVDTRRLVLHAGPGSVQNLLDDLNTHSDGKVDMALGRNGVAGRDDVLILYRRRSEVLTSAAWLAGDGHQFRLRMSGYSSRIAPWLGAVFCDWPSPMMRRDDFLKRWADRVPDHWRSPSVEQAWQSLFRHAGNSATNVDVKRLREVLSRRQTPLDFASPEMGEGGPILGTIHASKGRESEEVHLMLADVQNEAVVDADELRVVFVGATRARRVLKIGKAGGRYSSQCASGRRYHTARGGKGAQIELGRDGDFDDLSVVSQAFQTDSKSAAAVQSMLLRLGGSPVSAQMYRTAAGGGEYRWILGTSDRGQQIAQANDLVNKDLWEISASAASSRGGTRMRPPSSINHLHMLCCRTVVRAHGDASLPLLHEPWASSGFWLAPVVFAYSTAYFNNA